MILTKTANTSCHLCNFLRRLFTNYSSFFLVGSISSRNLRASSSSFASEGGVSNVSWTLWRLWNATFRLWLIFLLLSARTMTRHRSRCPSLISDKRESGRFATTLSRMRISFDSFAIRARCVRVIFVDYSTSITFDHRVSPLFPLLCRRFGRIQWTCCLLEELPLNGGSETVFSIRITMPFFQGYPSRM